MTIKTAFDFDAHWIITALLDETEERLVREKGCEPQTVNDTLCLHYVKEVSGIMSGAQWYVRGDERAGAGIFLSKLHGGKAKLRATQKHSRCVDQLIAFTDKYFLNYQTVLAMAYLTEIPTFTKTWQVTMSGLTKLACKDIPGAASDYRRLLRRLGNEYRNAFVTELEMTQAQARYNQPILENRVDKPKRLKR